MTATLLFLQDIPALLQGPPELLINPHVSFGLQQLYPVSQQQPNPSFWSAAALGLPDQATHPFAALGASPVIPSQLSVEEEEGSLQVHQPYHFRQIVIKNRGTYDMLLVDVQLSRVLPALPNTFAVLDDHHISQFKTQHPVDIPASQNKSFKIGGSTHSSPPRSHMTDQEQQSGQQSSQQSEKKSPTCQGVLLSPGHEYQITVALHCCDGSYRK